MRPTIQPNTQPHACLWDVGEWGRDSVGLGSQRSLCGAAVRWDKRQEVRKRQREALHNGGTVYLGHVTTVSMCAPNNTASNTQADTGRFTDGDSSTARADHFKTWPPTTDKASTSVNRKQEAWAHYPSTACQRIIQSYSPNQACTFHGIYGTFF